VAKHAKYYVNGNINNMSICELYPFVRTPTFFLYQIVLVCDVMRRRFVDRISALKQTLQIGFIAK